jgi:hypothetical protein
MADGDVARVLATPVARRLVYAVMCIYYGNV